MIEYAFPEFDMATLPLIPATWEDISWRNDVCPSWQSNGYQIFVNFENPDDREYSGGERFLVSDITTNEVYLMTDDWNEILTFVD
jgi:hypothetical protein